MRTTIVIILITVIVGLVWWGLSELGKDWDADGY